MGTLLFFRSTLRGTSATLKVGLNIIISELYQYRVSLSRAPHAQMVHSSMNYLVLARGARSILACVGDILVTACLPQ